MHCCIPDQCTEGIRYRYFKTTFEMSCFEMIVVGGLVFAAGF
jgi:hypothetical protein